MCVCVHSVAMVTIEVEFDTTSAAYSSSLLMKSLQWKVGSYGCSSWTVLLQVLLDHFPKG